MGPCVRHDSGSELRRTSDRRVKHVIGGDEHAHGVDTSGNVLGPNKRSSDEKRAEQSLAGYFRGRASKAAESASRLSRIVIAIVVLSSSSHVSLN
jgi:hypothetical protein